MADISASMVMKLRKISGQGMMDCKHALAEAAGDLDKAMDILRKKGLATLAKRAERETTEGIVVSRTRSDGRTAALATLCCETDFVAKSDDFIAAAGILADCTLLCKEDSGVENLLETEFEGKTFREHLTELVSKTGEKTEVGDYARFTLNGPGLLTVYIHFNKKIGTMIEAGASDEAVANSDEVKRTLADVAMHITAINPLALDKNGISPEVIESERAIYAEQVKGKPENIIEKIVEGKLNKFFAEKCLLAQAFVKDDSKTVAQVVEEAAKKASGTARIKRFVRFSVG
jgi:elongation factor Ts